MINYRKHYLVFAVAVFLLNWRGTVRAQSRPEERPLPVSLIRVIANPENFDSRRLRVIGVLGWGGGLDQSVCLYISETDARNGVMPNCISINQSIDKGDKHLGKYVILNATFHYESSHGLEYLSFKQISDMKLWPPQQEK